jgi:hypothetical protein
LNRQPQRNESVMSSRKPARPIVPPNLRKPAAVVAAAIVLGGGAYGIVSATASNGSSATTTTGSPATAPRQGIRGAAGSNARSGPAAGGAAGTVAAVSASSFTLTTAAGQTVTVSTASSTKYEKGTSSTSADAVKNGESVLVFGTTNGTTITASQIDVQPVAPGAATPSAAAVIPFQQGAPSTAKQAGQIPRTTPRAQGRSSAEQRRTRRPQPRWPPTPGASSTVS